MLAINKYQMESLKTDGGWVVPRGNERQWIEFRGGRPVTVSEHPVRGERVEFLNEPADPQTGPITVRFTFPPGQEIPVHTHPMTETFTVERGRFRAILDGEEQIVERGHHERIPSGVPHGYGVLGNEEGIMVGTFDPALSIKEVFLAEHALAPEDYPASGLNVPYVFLIIKRYGNLIELESSGPVLKIAGPLMRFIARIRGLKIPDEPLPGYRQSENPFTRDFSDSEPNPETGTAEGGQKPSENSGEETVPR